jgi:lipid-A-disaccharide synthase-like uncharacterized protein
VGPIIIYSRGNAQKEKERKKKNGALPLLFWPLSIFCNTTGTFPVALISLSLSLVSSFLFFSVCGGDVRGDFFIFHSVVVVVDRSAARMVVAS